MGGARGRESERGQDEEDEGGQGEGAAKGVMRGARTRRMGRAKRGRESQKEDGRGKGEDDGETKEGKQEGGHMLKPKQHGNLATATALCANNSTHISDDLSAEKVLELVQWYAHGANT